MQVGRGWRPPYSRCAPGVATQTPRPVPGSSRSTRSRPPAVGAATRPRGAEGEPRTRAVILSFDCLPADASVRIMTDQSLRQGSVESRLTLDAEPPLRVPGFAGTTASGGQVVLTIPQDSLLSMFGGHHRA